MLTRWFAAVCAWLILAVGVRGEEILPPAPTRHFNDYAGVVNASDAHQLDQRLIRYERETTNQFVVAIFQKLETQSSLEDHARRVFNAWKVGQADKNNGVVLFVFIKDRKMRIQVGLGLTNALPDAFCQRVLNEKLTPAFRRGDYSQGLRDAVNAVIDATRPQTANPPPTASPPPTETPAAPTQVNSTVSQPLPKPVAARVNGSSHSLISSLTGGFFCFFPFIFIAVLAVALAKVTGNSGRRPTGSRYDPNESFHRFHSNSSSSGFSDSGFSGSSSGGGSSDSGFSGGGGSSDGGGSSGSW
jgi:uncharacterized protein